MADSPWWLLRELMRPHRRALGGYGVVLSIATALPLVGSLLLARFVSLAVDGSPAHRLVPLALGYAACGLMVSFVTVAVTWRATTLAWRITDGLRHELADRVLHADLAFHRDRTPGELVTRVDADVTAMTQFLSQVVARVIAIALLGVAAVAVAAVVEPLLAPVLAAGLVLIGSVTWVQRNSANAATTAERAAEADVMGVAEEYLAAAEEVAALGGGGHGVNRVAVGSDRLVRAVGRRVRVQMRVQGTIRTAIIGAEVLVIACGALFAGAGWLSLPAVFLGYRFVAVVRQPVESLTWRLQEAQGASGAARRVLDLLEETRQLPDGDESLPVGPLDIRFEGVELVYDDGPEAPPVDDEPAAAALGAPAVARLDLHLRAGRATGLVGRSGSGKTSLARLVLRLVPPTTGRVLVGGVDLQRVADADLRRRIAAVPQDVQLFPGTVYDNVALFAESEPALTGATVGTGPAPADGVGAALTAAGLGPWAAGAARRPRQPDRPRRSGRQHRRRPLRRGGPAPRAGPGATPRARRGRARRGHVPGRPPHRGRHPPGDRAVGPGSHRDP